MSRLALTRRNALAMGGALTFLAASGRAAFANVTSESKIVLVILRGAMDGLAAVVPYADPHYAALRGRIAIPAPGAAGGVLAISDGFGLHPRFSFLHGEWQEGRLAVMHAAASPYRDRSHFDGQDVLESGGDRVFALSDGWLNRALGLMPAAGKFEGLAVARTIPLVLRGPATVASWSPSIAPAAHEDTIARLMDLYAGDAMLGGALAQALETADVVGESGMAPGQEMMRGARAYGAGAYAMVAKAAAKLIAAPGGPAAAVLSFDGWDTHVNQGGAEGQLAQRFTGLDSALKAMRDELGSTWSKTVVVVATEFGRTVAVNGNNGTDHGTGGVAFVAGGAVKGGRMLGDWPGLAPAALHENRDLAPANDLRGLFASVLEQHWGLARAGLQSRVFPGAGLPFTDGLIG